MVKITDYTASADKQVIATLNTFTVSSAAIDKHGTIYFISQSD